MRRRAGISQVEVLIAMVLIVTALVPAIDALRGGLDASRLYEDRVVDHYRLRGRMEEVLAESFSSLEEAAEGSTTPSTFSDPATSANRVLVYVSRWDADEADGDDDRFTGADDGILWVRAELATSGEALEVLTTP